MSDVAPAEAAAGADARGARGGASGRRRLLTAGLSGAALAALVARPAGATAGTEAPADSTPEATTTAAPKRPTGDDVTKLMRLQAIELSALELYRSINPDVLAGDHLFALATIASDHDQYAEALGALLGTKGVHTSDPAVVADWKDGFTGPDGVVVAQNARSFELALVATYIQLLGEIDGLDATNLLASIAPVEARHATVLADMAGLQVTADLESFAAANEATSLLIES